MVQRSFLGTSTLAFAHRGGGGDAPENTWAAFEAAVALGYRYLETDVQLTRDGVLLTFHDNTLDRLTDRTGAIVELTHAEIREADAGYAFSPDGGLTFPYRGTGVAIPTLEELLTRWDHVFVNIDAKTDETVAPLVELITRLDAFGRVCIGSFSDRRVARIRALEWKRRNFRIDLDFGRESEEIARVLTRHIRNAADLTLTPQQRIVIELGHAIEVNRVDRHDTAFAQSSERRDDDIAGWELH